MKKINLNKKIIVAGLILIGTLLILVLLRNSNIDEKISFNKESKITNELEPKSEEESAEIFLYRERDLETAVGKNVFLKAELYFEKLPILKFGNTYIYCWDKSEKDGRRGIARKIIDDLAISRGSDKGTKVRVWGKFSKYHSESDATQLIEGNYQIEYYRMEIDDGNIDSQNENYCYSNNSLWDCIDKKVLMEGTYIQEEDSGGKGGAFPHYEFNDVKWGKANFSSLNLGPFAPFSRELNAKRIIIEGIPRVGKECCKNCQCLGGQIAGRWPNQLEITDYKIFD